MDKRAVIAPAQLQTVERPARAETIATGHVRKGWRSALLAADWAVVVPLFLLILAVSTDHFEIRVGSINLRTELIAGGLLAAWLLVRRVSPAGTSTARGFTLLKGIGLVEWCLLGWLGANALSSLLFSPVRGESLKYTLIIAGMVTLYGVGFLLLRSARAVVWAALAWVIVGSGVMLLGLLAALFYVFFVSFAGISFTPSFDQGVFSATPLVYSTIWEANIFGSYSLTVSMLAYALSRAPEFRGARWQWAFRVAIALAFCGTLLSLTRTAWAGAALLVVLTTAVSLLMKIASWRQVLTALYAPALTGAFVGLLLTRVMPIASWTMYDPNGVSYYQIEEIARQILSGATVAVVPSVGAPGETTQHLVYAVKVGGRKESAFNDRLGDLVSSSSKPTLSNRQQVLAKAFDGWLNRPIFGWGTGSYQYVYPGEPMSGDGFWVSNLELHALFDTGLVGFGLLLVAFATAVWRAFHALRRADPSVIAREGQPGWGPAQYALFGILLGGVGLLFAYQLTEGSWLGFTWVFFAMLVAAGRNAAPAPQSAGEP